MLKTDVLVIGSSAGGMVAAVTGKRINPDKKFTVVTINEKTLVPCGIPYVFGTLGTTNKNIIPVAENFAKMGIEFINDEVLEIIKEEKKVLLKNGQDIAFDKLIIATGSLPFKPLWLKGADFNNVYAVPKNKIYLDAMQEKLEQADKIVVIGAGFIGVEMSDELHKAGKDVTLLERLPNILSLAFDADISDRAEVILKDNGVKVLTNTTVKEITGLDRADGVLLDDGTKIDADAVILSMGYKPNSELAIKAHLGINDAGFIKVDEYMRTSHSDIFAVGDCAEKKHFITGESVPMMLASTACAEARLVGLNLFGISAIKTFTGTISIFSTALGSRGFGVAGITEKEAKAIGINYVCGSFEGADRHPASLADTQKQFVKFIVAKDSGVILGGEVAGGLSTGELTNTIGMMIQNRMNISSLLTAQVGSHPLMTASPAGFPLIKAAEMAVYNMLKK
ncbi:FAD-dependent oxidoreductase [bacterium]|nr:FAD-dependent oxidoreductase [bacterium]